MSPHRISASSNEESMSLHRSNFFSEESNFCMLNATWDQTVVGSKTADVATPEPSSRNLLLHMISGEFHDDSQEKTPSISMSRSLLINADKLDDLLSTLRTNEFCGIVDPEGGHSAYLDAMDAAPTQPARNESMPVLSGMKPKKKLIGSRKAPSYRAQFKEALQKTRSGPSLSSAF